MRRRVVLMAVVCALALTPVNGMAETVEKCRITGVKALYTTSGRTKTVSGNLEAYASGYGWEQVGETTIRLQARRQGKWVTIASKTTADEAKPNFSFRVNRSTGYYRFRFSGSAAKGPGGVTLGSCNSRAFRVMRP